MGGIRVAVMAEKLWNNRKALSFNNGSVRNYSVLDWSGLAQYSSVYSTVQ